MRHPHFILVPRNFSLVLFSLAHFRRNAQVSDNSKLFPANRPPPNYNSPKVAMLGEEQPDLQPAACLINPQLYAPSSFLLRNIDHKIQ